MGLQEASICEHEHVTTLTFYIHIRNSNQFPSRKMLSGLRSSPPPKLVTVRCWEFHIRLHSIPFLFYNLDSLHPFSRSHHDFKERDNIIGVSEIQNLKKPYLKKVHIRQFNNWEGIPTHRVMTQSGLLVTTTATQTLIQCFQYRILF